MNTDSVLELSQCCVTDALKDMVYVWSSDGFDARLTVGFGILHHRQERPLGVLQPYVDQRLCTLLPAATGNMQKAGLIGAILVRIQFILAGKADKSGLASKLRKCLMGAPGLA